MNYGMREIWWVSWHMTRASCIKWIHLAGHICTMYVVRTRLSHHILHHAHRGHDVHKCVRVYVNTLRLTVFMFHHLPFYFVTDLRRIVIFIQSEADVRMWGCECVRFLFQFFFHSTHSACSGKCSECTEWSLPHRMPTQHKYTHNASL